jgi:hypothetical protein
VEVLERKTIRNKTIVHLTQQQEASGAAINTIYDAIKIADEAGRRQEEKAITICTESQEMLKWIQ